MKIILAKTAGFCFGVNRAVDIVEKLAESGKSVCTLGPIIHNAAVVTELESKGVREIAAPEMSENNETIVIRSHGVPKTVFDGLRKAEAEFVDATCPFVSKIHKIVAAANENDIVLIAGDSNHPEVKGIIGHSACCCKTFMTVDELDELIKIIPQKKYDSVCLVAQTTFNEKEFEICVNNFKKVYTNGKVFGTICNATSERQKEAEELSKICDAMLVIGDRNSSNTKKLFSICANNCGETFFLESSAELDAISFEGYRSIGVTAGASTPDRIIKEVLDRMSEITKTSGEAVAEATEEISVEQTQEEIKEEVMETAVEEAADAAEKSGEQSFEEMLEESLKGLNTNERVNGVVVGIAPNEIYVDVGRKQAGYVPLSELTSDPNAKPEDIVKIGDEFELLIMKTNDQEGTIMLSKRRVDAQKSWGDLEKFAENGEILEGVVTEIVNGGIIALYNNNRVFIPASQATTSRDVPLEELKGQTVNFRILEASQKGRRRRVVGSIRSVLRDQRSEQKKLFWDTAEVGKAYQGVVKTLTGYGAFVDLGGVFGMIHVSELSWSRIKHPSEVVNVGDTVEVYIKDINTETNKISLGFKKAEDNPWEIFKKNYEVDSVVEATIVGMTTFGAFANIIPGIDGLIHISQISNERVEKPQDVLKVGEKVKAKITQINFEDKRVSLSMRALIEVEAPTEEPEEVDNSPKVYSTENPESYADVALEEEPKAKAAEPVAEAAVEEPKEEAVVEEIKEEAVEEKATEAE